MSRKATQLLGEEGQSLIQLFSLLMNLKTPQQVKRKPMDLIWLAVDSQRSGKAESWSQRFLADDPVLSVGTFPVARSVDTAGQTPR